MELSHQVLVSFLNSFPSGGFFIKVGLSGISVTGGSVSEVFLMGNIGIDNIKFGVIVNKSSFSIGDGLVGDSKESFKGSNLFNIDSVSFESGIMETLFQLVQEIQNFCGSGLVSKVLSNFGKGFS